MAKKRKKQNISKKPVEKTETKDSVEIEINFKQIFSSIDSKVVIYALLTMFIFMGFFLRFYHVEYPVIGYHNWKVAHYITEARNFARDGFFKFGFFVPMRDSMERYNEQRDGAHNDTFPTIQIIVGFLFKIFGESLVVARTANILFSLGSVIAFYLLIKELFNKESLALIAAFFAAVNPMYVFFSHNVQVINPGLFFMLLGAYYYVKWVNRQLDKKKFSNLYLATFFVMMGAVTKYTFAIMVIPILLSFPYSKVLKNIKGFIKPILVSGAIASFFPLWILYTEFYVKKFIFGVGIDSQALSGYGFSKLVDLSIIWNSGFWLTMRSYVADNFTMQGMLFMFLGLLLLLFLAFSKRKEKYIKTFYIGYFLGIALLFVVYILKSFTPVLANVLWVVITFFFMLYFIIWSIPFYVLAYLLNDKSSFGNKFALGYVISTIPFIFVMGFKLSGHNYHQFPIAPIMIFLISYFIFVVANNFKMLPKQEIGFLVVCTLLIVAKYTNFPIVKSVLGPFTNISGGILLFILVVSGILVGLKYTKRLPKTTPRIVFISLIVILSSSIFFPFGLSSRASPTEESMNRMFDTQIPGLDVAGNYINTHAAPDDRFFHSSGQSFGILWHANRKGYKGPPNVETFIISEEQYNVNWVFVYNWAFHAYCMFGVPCNEVEREVGDYLNSNYRPVQFGFTLQNNQAVPLYVLFRKGGNYTESELNNLIQGKQQISQNYIRTSGSYNIVYINLE